MLYRGVKMDALKNTMNSIEVYAESYKKAKSVYDQAADYINGKYKENSEWYVNQMEQAKTTLYDTITPLRDLCTDNVKKEFNKVREELAKIVTTQPTQNLQTIIKMIKDEKLTKVETDMIIDKYKHNYMDDKLIHDAIDIPFTTVEKVIEDLDQLEKDINHFFLTYKGEELTVISYSNALILNGAYVKNVGTTADDFINKYTSGLENQEYRSRESGYKTSIEADA